MIIRTAVGSVRAVFASLGASGILVSFLAVLCAIAVRTLSLGSTALYIEISVIAFIWGTFLAYVATVLAGSDLRLGQNGKPLIDDVLASGQLLRLLAEIAAHGILVWLSSIAIQEFFSQVYMVSRLSRSVSVAPLLIGEFVLLITLIAINIAYFRSRK